MKPLLVVTFLFFAFPAAALGGASLTMREVPLHGERTLAASTTHFDMVGLHWRGSGTVEFRTRSVEGRWSGWQRADPEGEDLPNVGTAEARAALGWRVGNPYWAGASDRIEYRLRGHIERLRAYFVRSPDVRIPLRRVSMTGSPPLIDREAWGANETIRRAPPSYATALQFALVHHTAGTNSYTASQSAAIVRGIEVYHVKGNGWNDIGYNFLVDKYGQVRRARQAPGLAPRHRARRSQVDVDLGLGWKRALRVRCPGLHPRRVRASRHGIYDVSGRRALLPARRHRAAGGE